MHMGLVTSLEQDQRDRTDDRRMLEVDRGVPAEGGPAMIGRGESPRYGLIFAPPSATEALRSQLERVRTLSRALVVGLSDADASGQSMPDASPSKWHLAHTTWFFETFVLCEFVRDYRVFDSRFAYLFNSYYESKGIGSQGRPAGMLTRPSLDEFLPIAAMSTLP